MNENTCLLLNIKKINFINETKIFNEIQNHKAVLIFDLRTRSDFLLRSLPNSLNLPFDENKDEFFENFINNIHHNLTDDQILKEMLRKFRRFYIAIIYSDEKYNREEIINFNYQKIKDDNSLYKALCLYNSLVSNKVREIGVHLKGFSRIFSKYSFLVRNSFNQPLLK